MSTLTKRKFAFLILILLTLIFPAYASANSPHIDEDTIQDQYIAFAEEVGEEIELFQEDSSNSEIVYLIADESEVELLQKGEVFSQVKFLDEENDEEIIGYIKNERLVNISEAEQYRKNRNIAKQEDPSLSIEENQVNKEDKEANEKISEQKLSTNLDKVENVIQSNDNLNQEKVEDNEENEIRDNQKYNDDVRQEFRGIALQSITNVYQETSTDSNIWKSYEQGSILKYRFFSSEWYEARVSVDGKWQTGYIHKDHVENIVANQEVLYGYGLKSPTNIYSKASDNAPVLKTYALGSRLKYKSLTSGWYEATVYVDGKPYTGFINASDVGDLSSIAKSFYGIGLKSPTNVYKNTNTGSGVWKSYTQGSILKYKLFKPGWYEATVYVNGKRQTGYIYANDIETLYDSTETLRGIGLKNPTKVYELASTRSKTLKTYVRGSILKYQSFSRNWYKATVYINGKARTGYIYKSDVENSVAKQQTLREKVYNRSGVKVYSLASTSSDVLKSYPKGRELIVRTFTNGWYEATVYINGKRKTGYIEKSSLNGKLKGKVIVLDPGHGGSDPGAVANGIIEKNLNLNVALALKEKLEGEGATVVLTRSTDVFVPLTERPKVSEAVNADIFVSIHANASGGTSARGVESYYNNKLYNGEKNPYPTESKLLAEYINNSLAIKTGMHNRGIYDAGFVVTRQNTVPSCLIELGFLTNPGDAAKMKASNYKNLAADGILNGIVAYFQNIK